jgi:preprotein translocase subunit SecA|tara:strand:+ start:2614 stop:5124 length:2511 start_codon:yes stop_codon:yes gene_type:complete
MKKLIYDIKLEADKLNQKTEEELELKIAKIKKRAMKEPLEDLITEWFALIQEVSFRQIGLRHFDTQLLAGILLHQGKIVEMKTGEGKTLVSTLPVGLNALTKKGVHVVTVNDYLAERDKKWMGKVYNGLGLSVGLVKSNSQTLEKQKSYNSDITYVTNSEVVFDYLRDSSAYNLNEIVQRPFNFCLIDEIDSVLIDEARTPLILSEFKGSENLNKLYFAKAIANILEEDIDFELDEKRKDINLTERGYKETKNKLGKNTLYDPDDPWILEILNALKAKYFFKLNKDYIILNNKIVIVDEFTGRIMEDRRWSMGLHEAVEIKEEMDIGGGTKTKSSITYQNFFTLYPTLAGMTGTAKTTEKEFKDIYNLDVVVLPTVKPLLRQDLADLVYQNEVSKWKAVLNQSKECFEKGQPVLIGTATIEKSEFLSDLFKISKIPHQVLNAKPENVTRENEIVAQAGERSAVTIATNMAGRGTDIILGGNPTFKTKQELWELLIEKKEIPTNLKDPIEKICGKYTLKNNLKQLENDIKSLPYSLDTCEVELKNIYDTTYKTISDEWKKENQIVKNLGGLFVLGTERHETRRIDNQLRGRAGRQGDPGVSQFFVSLEDELIKVFGGDSIRQWVNYLIQDDDTPLESNLLTKSLENAQKKVELYNYDMRKNVFQYDDILNSQRKQLFNARNELVFKNIYEELFLRYDETCLDEELRKDKQIKNANFEKSFDSYSNYEKGQEKVKTNQNLYKEIWISHDLRFAQANFYQLGFLKNTRSTILLTIVDFYWTEHLERMSYIRETINWRSYGQQNPLIEYNFEAFKSFKLMFEQIRSYMLYYFLNNPINFQ